MLSRFTIADLQGALAGLGIADGATIVIHSSLMHLGFLVGAPGPEYPERLTDAILDMIGPNGTAAVPASNWDYGLKGIPFDLQRTPAAKDLGVLGNHFLGRSGVVRSPNPTFSLAFLGAGGKWFCEGGNAHAFGYDSAWDRLFQVDTDMVFLGCSLEDMSFIRYMEMRFGVPYLYNKLFTAAVLSHDQPVSQPIVSLLRYRSIPVTYSLQRFEETLRGEGVLRETQLGGGAVKAVRMKRCFDVGMKCLKQDIHYFLASKPNYPPDQIPVV